MQGIICRVEFSETLDRLRYTPAQRGELLEAFGRLGENPRSGAVFVFINRSRNLLDGYGYYPPPAFLRASIDGSSIEEVFQQHGAVFLTTESDFFHTIPDHHAEHSRLLSSRCGNRTGKL